MKKEIAVPFGKLKNSLKTKILLFESQKLRAWEENPRNWLYLETVFSLLLLFFLLLFALRPAVLAITDLVGQIKTKRRLVRQETQTINQIIVAQDAFAQLAGKMNILEEYYPHSLALTSGLAQVLGLALDNKLTVADVNFGKIVPPRQTRQPGALDFTLQLVGDYPAIKNFLQETTRVRRVIQVNSFKLSPLKIEGEEEIAGIKLQLRGRLLFWSPKARQKKR